MRPSRILIVNADDFGLSDGVNRGIVQAHDYGVVTSASMMVHKPATAQAAALARDRPLLSLGLHIDVGEWRYENGCWLASYERVSQNDPLALKAAVTEQIDIFRDLTGADPTHLDSHQHAHKRDPLRSVLNELAFKLGVPLRHFHPDVSYCGDFYGQDEKGQPLAERLTAPFLINIIAKLRDGVTELACHPAAELDFQSSYYQERMAELQVLCSPVVHRAIVRSGVTLTSFADDLSLPQRQTVPSARSRQQ